MPLDEIMFPYAYKHSLVSGMDLPDEQFEMLIKFFARIENLRIKQIEKMLFANTTEGKIKIRFVMGYWICRLMEREERGIKSLMEKTGMSQGDAWKTINRLNPKRKRKRDRWAEKHDSWYMKQDAYPIHLHQ